MNSMARIAAAVAIASPFLMGCATTGHDQTEAQVGATYRLVKNLDSTLGPSVTKLNEATADLGARADASDKEIAKLQSMSEDNQKRLERIQSKLDKLANVIYKDRGMSPGDSSAPAPAAPPTSEDPRIEPPKVTTKTERTEPVQETPAPKSEPAPGNAKNDVAPPPAPAESTSNAAADFAAAQASFDGKKYADAARQFKEFLQRYPDNEKCERAQIRAAYCYGQLADYEKAAAEYSKFRAKYSNSSTNMPLALWNEATAYQKLNQKARATELLKELIENYPTHPAAESARASLKALQANN